MMMGAPFTVERAPYHCKGRGATAMRDIPNDDRPGFVAERPEHCFACYRLIRPGQTYYLTIEGIVHCEDCALSEGRDSGERGSGR